MNYDCPDMIIVKTLVNNAKWIIINDTIWFGVVYYNLYKAIYLKMKSIAEKKTSLSSLRTAEPKCCNKTHVEK